jgi:hypothetical protein
VCHPARVHVHVGCCAAWRAVPSSIVLAPCVFVVCAHTHPNTHTHTHAPLRQAAMSKAGLADDCAACDDAKRIAAELPASDVEALPAPGEVEFIMGGPPCQGYSGMNRCAPGGRGRACVDVAAWVWRRRPSSAACASPRPPGASRTAHHALLRAIPPPPPTHPSSPRPGSTRATGAWCRTAWSCPSCPTATSTARATSCWRTCATL